MTLVNCIRTRRKGKHLTFEDRLEIERLVELGINQPSKKMSQRQMAERIGTSVATLNRELKRGKYETRTSEWKPVIGYSASIAQNDYDEKAKAKGPKLKIGKNFELEKLLEREIIENKRSPYRALQILKNTDEYKKTPISLRTLYNYIENEYFLNITKKDCPRKGKASRRKYQRVGKRVKDYDAKSIKDRPEEANNRSELGHWEMDCVESGKKKSKACLLTMIDRKSRESIIIKLRSQTQKAVIGAIDNLEIKYGEEFYEKFKTITVDNGMEFLDWRSMEMSKDRKREKTRTEIYFCHSYCSWEKGSVEQLNGMIRRFIPKGANISDYSKEEIKWIEDHINTNPRRILDGKSSNELLETLAS